MSYHAAALNEQAMARNSGDLEAIAQGQFPALKEAERRLLRAAAKGETAICGMNNNDNDRANDPANGANWGHEREIRAGLIRWLCTDPEASKKVDALGLSVYAAKITAELNLRSVTVPFPLSLNRCYLNTDSDLYAVNVPSLDLRGTFTQSFNLDFCDVKGVIFLTDGFSSEGEVRLLGAKIGRLECWRSNFRNPGKMALTADSADVKSDVLFTEGFSAEGEVRGVGIRIGGNLDCNGGSFRNPGGKALHFSGAEVGGNIFISKGFSSEGEVNFVATHIGINLDCVGTVLKNPNNDALIADSADIKGNVFLNDFSADGTVNLTSAHIGRSLETLNWKGVTKSTVLLLQETSAGSFSDEEESWPNKGNLYLDGFVYGSIASGPTDARTRLEWLDRESEFRPQPYRHLAKVLRERGDEDGAKQVSFEMESRARAADRRRLIHDPPRWLLRSAENLLSDATVGYGIYPARAAWYLVGLTALGWIVHRRAERLGHIAPKDKDAYKEFRANNGRAPDYYPPFNPFIYSLENCLPLVKLGQDDHWQPDPNAPQQVLGAPPARWGSRGWLRHLLRVRLQNWIFAPPTLRGFRWFMIGVGWLLATFVVGAVSGLIKTGQ
jgi:hypothetical protein